MSEYPDDPYFLELKGQILFESGRIEEAIPLYGRAVALIPNAPLLRVGLAHAQIESNQEALAEDALSNLMVAMRHDETIHWSGAWPLPPMAVRGGWASPRWPRPSTRCAPDAARTRFEWRNGPSAC